MRWAEIFSAIFLCINVCLILHISVFSIIPGIIGLLLGHEYLEVHGDETVADRTNDAALIALAPKCATLLDLFILYLLVLIKVIKG